MKKLWIALPLLLMLTGCGGADFDPASVAGHYADRPVEGTYTVTTHQGFYTEYRLQTQVQGEQSVVTVLAPASVAGIRAVLQPGQTTIRYEDAAIDALLPPVSGFAPMDVLHGIAEDLRDNIPVSTVAEQETVVLDYQETLPDGTETRKQVVLGKSDLALRSAELYLAGDLILALRME